VNAAAVTTIHRPYAYLKGEGLTKAPLDISTMDEGIPLYNHWSLEAQRRNLRQHYGYAMLVIRAKLVKSFAKTC